MNLLCNNAWVLRSEYIFSFSAAIVDNCLIHFIFVKVDVIVNTAGGNLNLSSNPCAKALSNAAGPQLQAECSKITAGGSVSEWDFAKTTAGRLNCKFVYHAVCGGYDKGAGQSEKVRLRKSIVLSQKLKNGYYYLPCE